VDRGTPGEPAAAASLTAGIDRRRLGFLRRKLPDVLTVRAQGRADAALLVRPHGLRVMAASTGEEHHCAAR
jgi:hypothetical protein